MNDRDNPIYSLESSSKKLFQGMVEELNSGEGNAEHIADFLVVLAVCHTVVTDHDEQGEVRCGGWLACACACA